jgi:Putative nuclear localisation signal of quaking
VKILVACEFSGVVREAFNAIHGCHAVSCDIIPCSDGRVDYHRQCDVLSILDEWWDLIIAFPPCRFLCVSGMHWTTRGLRDPKDTEAALKFVRKLMNTKCKRIAIENPVGIISTRIRKSDQRIQPYQFGDDASKKTCLWLKGLPPLVHTKYIQPRIVKGKKRWSNQTDSGQNKLAPSDTRAADRAITYPGIARAMADQWSNL